MYTGSVSTELIFRNALGIFNLDTAGTSKRTQKFLNSRESANEFKGAEIPESFAVFDEKVIYYAKTSKQMVRK